MSFQRTTRSDREPSRLPMGSSIRSGAGTRTTMRQQAIRQSTARSGSVRPDRSRAVSPAESVASGTKRKERDFESPDPGMETNINVVVRCRGRNQREVKENSTVMVTTDGVKGKVIDLSMGPSALSNKSYSFDRVYSAAADQSMIFDETVKPILEEMLSGFNCTIFAYGQTGTGKTYTMSGDMTESLGILSPEAGIIPRVLQQLFNKLELDDTENVVKCSFIELYNEELRDLLSIDETAKLKIYDDASRRGHLSTIVQGMEEKHIKDAAEGIKVLQDGSSKRQVAATKCNDLSSRSHTVFTITAYVKKTNEHGVEDLVSAGKLNLVDLAGSENIQRSGAENKRAAEAGLINKSLLTLGRVINALVDRNPHIPYRESKLTRLLQDSLGGRTKTCIIATISPAKANLEETISTLEYAFRAKNIKNKPQMNAMLNKKTLLKEFTAEIEKLKSELITTRQRNGVYLSNDAYEEMTAQSESRRIVLDEQSDKIVTLETNLRNKVQELFSLTTNFMGLKKDHDSTKVHLDETKGVLDQTETVLSATRKTLAEETELRKAHQETEDKLAQIGGELINSLHKTTQDISGLHAKNKRKSDLQNLNRTTWDSSQNQVAEVTAMVERRLQEFTEEQQEHITSMSRRVGSFVGEEVQKSLSTQEFLDANLDMFTESVKLLLENQQHSKDHMDEVLNGIGVIRQNLSERNRENLKAYSTSIGKKIESALVGETELFHNQLHTSYSGLGKDFKSFHEDLAKHLASQKSKVEAQNLELQSDTTAVQLGNTGASTKLQEACDEQKRQFAEERQKALEYFETLWATQETRIDGLATQMQQHLVRSNEMLEGNMSRHTDGMKEWSSNEERFLEQVKDSRDQLKTRLKDDWTAASERSLSIQNAAKHLHEETVRVVDDQVGDLDREMETLDDFVTRAKSDNSTHHESRSQAVNTLKTTVEKSFDSFSTHCKATWDRVKNLGEEMEMDVNDLKDGLEPLDSQLSQPLANLREEITGSKLQEYQPTGETPQKIVYQYPTSLPRTKAPSLLNTTIDEESPETDIKDEGDKDNTIVFADLEPSPSRPLTAGAIATSLREVNPNVTNNLTTGSFGFEPRASSVSVASDHTMPLIKSTTRASRGLKRQISGEVGEGMENMLPTLTEIGSKRKSPRLN